MTECDVDLNSAIDVKGKIRILIEGVKKIIMDQELPQEKILGIGINAPGPIDMHLGEIINPPNFDLWHNVNIVREFKKHFNLNVFLENNSKSLAIAEKNYGKGSEFNSFMLMVVDSGIGAGFVINENIYRGFYGLGSEIGHVSIDFNGKQCNCGNKGCMEVYASIPSVIENIQRYDKNITTWNEIVDKALDGNVKCKKAIEKEALYLSAGIVNVMNILELEAVVLTGTIRYKPDIIMESIQKNVWKSMITRKLHKLIITNSSIVKNPGVVSAASIIFERFFKGEI
jgi:predicted NBD/HSP70 family sugar kinase